MAKRRRLNQVDGRERETSSDELDAPLWSGTRGLDASGIALGMLAGTLVYVFFHPSDSVQVEQGDALWLAALVIVIACLAMTLRAWTGSIAVNHPSRNGKAVALGSLEVIPWLFAGWMMLAAFFTSPPGNLRMATNEAWWWVTAACLFTAARSLLAAPSARKGLIGLLVVGACGLAVHGLHQYFVSLPENRAEYQRDPDGVLLKAMLDAPAGSSERMVFENRLMDGGPTATFALANSLAAVLLLGVLLSMGVLMLQWRHLTPMQRVTWVVAAILCAACLLATRSRSATLAMMMGVAILVVAASRVLQGRSRFLGWGLVAVTGMGTITALCLALFGNREWFEEAPASLAVRFQYWRSSWQLVLDHPWFGAGPGNFQSMYERYREATATEQIAEPHNLWIETLAAGGFVALGLLLAGTACCAITVWTRDRSEDAADGDSCRVERWVWFGALVALALVWSLGWAAGQPPDVDASLWVVPLVLCLGWHVARSVHLLTLRDLDLVLVISLMAVGAHLMMSGGWSIPGVAVPVWLILGILTRLPPSDRAESCRAETALGRSAFQRSALAGTVLLAGGVLWVLLYVGSLRPVEMRRVGMARAAEALSRGRSQVAMAALNQAAAVDPWSPEASLWLADLFRWRLILEPTTSETRQAWEQALGEAARRAGDDPTVYRMIGAQQLHLFQRHGDVRDLQSAAASFGNALSWSPANQWLFAQMAVIERAQDAPQLAAELADRATILSNLGGNIERALSRQLVYVAQPVGRAAERGPVREPASDLLSEPTGPAARNSPE
jgi:hypothetical protein